MRALGQPPERQACHGGVEEHLAGPLDWVDWFNTRRLLEPIGNVPPAEAEERYYAQLEEPAPAAPPRRDSHQTASGKPGAVHSRAAQRACAEGAGAPISD